jgi:FkbM family methyltransferase
MALSDIVKKAFLCFLPEKLQTALKNRHYLRLVQTVTEDCFPIVQHLAAPGDQVVDIGANIGTYTYFLSGRVGLEGKVYAVEPVPETCQILRFCAERLQLRNVEISQCAISDHDGVTTMQIPRHSSGIENCYRAHITEENGAGELRSVTVTVRTIDSFLAGAAGPIAFIKIDVEGHEFAVVRGGLATFERFHPALLIEVTQDPDDPQSDSHKLFEMLRKLDYRPYCMEGQTVRPRRVGDQYVDYFFLTDSQAELLRRQGALGDGAP